ncbi:MAG TPA: YfhO family protein [Longimicrobiales bacterium]
MPRTRAAKTRPAAAAARPSAQGGAEERIPAWLPAAAYALAAVLLFREFVFGPAGLLGQDTTWLSYFARDFYREAVRSLGRFPLWDPLLFGGIPFVEGMHGDIFYPPTLALFLLDTREFWGWKMILHVFLAGIFCFLWLRRGLGLRRGPAFFGGLVYMMGADLVSLIYPGGDGKLFVSALAPLAFWLTERAVRHRRLHDFAFFALGVALIMFTSHMQAAYFTVWGITAYFLFRLVQLWRAERSAAGAARLFGLFALAGVLGVAAAAVQFVPPLLYLREWSHRAERTVQADAQTAYEYSTQWSMHPEEAMAMVVPEFVGANVPTEASAGDTYWGRNVFKLNHEYAGLVPLLLIPLAFVRRREARAWFFLALGGASLLYALGATTPAFRLFYLIPGVKLFRAPSMIIFLVGLSVATLGAMGLQRLLDWCRGAPEDRKAAQRALWIAVAALGALALLESAGVVTGFWRAVIYPDMAPDKAAAFQANLPAIRSGFWLAFALAGAVAGAWELASRDLLSGRGAVVLLAVLAALDLYRVDRDFIRGTVLVNQMLDPTFARPDGAIRFLQAEQARTDPFRVVDIGPGMRLGWHGGSPNTLAIHGLEQLGGHHGNEMGRYRTLIGGEGLRNFSQRLLDLTNTRYLLSPRPLEGVAGLTEVYRDPQAAVYRNESAFPRAFLVGAVEVVPDELAVVRILTDSMLDLRRTALLPEPLPAGIALEPDPVGTVEWLDREVDRYTLRVTTDRPALLVVSENYFPAWKAAVDGEPAPVLRANYTFRAVPVPAGAHEVRFEYRSDVLRASAFASLATLVLLLGVAAGGALRARRGGGGA